MIEIPRNKRQWISKQASGWCAVNHNMLKWNFSVTDQCPRCSQVETVNHMKRCPDKAASQQWGKVCTELEQWFRKRGTQPDITEIFMSRLRSWHSGLRPYRFPNRRFYGIQTALTSQDAAGWNMVLEGHVVQEWAHVQDRYYRFCNKRNTCRRWLTDVIKKLWDV